MFIPQFPALDKSILRNALIYYDLSSRGVAGTTVKNLVAPGTLDGEVVGTGWTYTDADRFGITKNSNANFTTSKYVTTPAVFNFTDGAAAIWIKLLSVGSSQSIGGFGGISPNYYIFDIFVASTGKPTFQVRQQMTPTEYSSTISLNSGVSTGQWNLIVGSWGSTYKHNLYLFNQSGFIEKSSANVSYYPGGSYSPYIGCNFYNNSPSNPFGGNVGEVIVWNRQISEAEIYQLFSTTCKRYLIGKR